MKLTFKTLLAVNGNIKSCSHTHPCLTLVLNIEPRPVLNFSEATKNMYTLLQNFRRISVKICVFIVINVLFVRNTCVCYSYISLYYYHYSSLFPNLNPFHCTFSLFYIFHQIFYLIFIEYSEVLEIKTKCRFCSMVTNEYMNDTYLMASRQLLVSGNWPDFPRNRLF
jgi:hypothetical protein